MVRFLRLFVLVAALLLTVNATARAAIHAVPGGPYSGNEGQSISFDGSGSTADATCFISTWQWSMGISSSVRYGENVTFTYNVPNTYTVTLRVDGYCGSSAVYNTATTTVTIADVAPVAAINAFGYTNGGPYTELIEEYANLNITFDATSSYDGAGSIVQYQWDLDYDGVNFNPVPSTLSTINRSYSNSGDYQVALRVTDDEGGTAVDVIDVRILNTGPIARIAGPETFPEGATRIYNAAGSDPGPAPPISNYEWDLHYDGETFDVEESGPDKGNVNVTFDQVGLYRIAVRVYDSYGGGSRYDQTSYPITVTNVLPTAVIDGPESFDEGQEVQFSAEGSAAVPGTIWRYEWDWDYNGSTFNPHELSHVPTVSKTYMDDGAHQIAVRVVDDDETWAVASMSIVVNDTAPVVQLHGPAQAPENLPSSFDTNGTTSYPDQIVAYAWDFNYDGSTFNPFADYGSPTARYTFPDAGTYTVAVKVTDEDGSETIQTISVEVLDTPPVAVITGPLTADEGDDIEFSGIDSVHASLPDSIAAYEWDLDYDGITFNPDAELGTGASSFIFQTWDNGKFTIGLRVTDDNGSTNITQHALTVNNVPPEFTSTPPASATQGDLYQYRPAVSDPGAQSDRLTFSLEVSPAGMTADVNTGRVSWTPGNQHVQQNNQVKLKVCDDDGGCDSQTWTIIVENVNDAPSIQSLTNTSATTCEAFSATVLASDPDWGDTLYYYLDEKPTGMTIGLRTGDIDWQPDIDHIGDNQITVRVEDSNGGQATDYFIVTVSPCGEVPSADAGENQTVQPGPLTLAGSASDPHDPPWELTYHWSQTGGVPVTFENGDTLTPTVILRKAGEYVFSLVANNGQYDSMADTVTVTVQAVAPVAQAACVPVTLAGETITLDATQSTDTNGDALTYTWSSDDISLQEDDLARVEGTLGNAGMYARFSLFANDGALSSNTWTGQVAVVNHTGTLFPPVVRTAETLSRIASGGTVSLDATPSWTVEGTEREYAWALTDGPVSQETLAQFNPALPQQDLLLTISGLYRFDVTVTADGVVSPVGTQWVAVATNDGNSAPEADAGASFTAHAGDTVSLDGSGSTDPDNDPLSYLWVQTGGSGVNLQQDTTVAPQFYALNPGLYTFELHVTDTRGQQGVPSRVTVAVLPQGVTLRADLAGQTVVNPEEEVTLDASASVIPQGSDYTRIVWCQDAGHPVLLTGIDTLTPTFTPPGPGTYGFTLNIFAAGAWSNPAHISVVVLSEANTPPVADAGADQQVDFGVTVTLDGSASHDDDGDELLYAWQLMPGMSAGEVFLDDDTGVAPSFVADMEGIFVFSLRVSDGKMWSEADLVTITVGENQAPVADAGENQSVSVDTQVTLDGSESFDPDGPAVELTYAWELVDETVNPLNDPTSATPTFTPQREGDYVFRLTVSDGLLQSEPATVTITATDDTVNCLDRDGDGYGIGEDCLGPDCDDLDKNRNEGIAGSCDDVIIDPKPTDGGSGGCAGSASIWMLALLIVTFRRRR